jgi:hypothetical protein
LSLLPRKVVLANLKEEMAGALRWARHHSLVHGWDESGLLLTVRLEGLADASGHREPYLITGLFDDYRVIPPAWRFVDPRTCDDLGLPAFPTAGSYPGGSVLHPNGVVCAPWNRLAYKTTENASGVHEDWGALTAWESAAPNHTLARTIPEMLGRLRLEVAMSNHRLAPLPPLQSTSEEGAA